MLEIRSQFKYCTARKAEYSIYIRFKRRHPLWRSVFGHASRRDARLQRSPSAVASASTNVELLCTAEEGAFQVSGHQQDAGVGGADCSVQRHLEGQCQSEDGDNNRGRYLEERTRVRMVV